MDTTDYAALPPTLESLNAILERLRAPDGCPWDREQTRETLARCLNEECAELLEAIDHNEPDAICDELGDLLMNIVFQAVVAKERSEFTLTDILAELEKPGRDPRQAIKVFEFDKNVKTIDDLKVGMTLPGIVTNITNFGCFVDVGIKENGLVHVSQLCREFVSDPTNVVSIHQHVQVKVIGIDMERKRISMTMILD